MVFRAGGASSGRGASLCGMLLGRVRPSQPARQNNSRTPRGGEAALPSALPRSPPPASRVSRSPSGRRARVPCSPPCWRRRPSSARWARWRLLRRWRAAHQRRPVRRSCCSSRPGVTERTGGLSRSRESGSRLGPHCWRAVWPRPTSKRAGCKTAARDSGVPAQALPADARALTDRDEASWIRTVS
jgi:hypothetical protein